MRLRKVNLSVFIILFLTFGVHATKNTELTSETKRTDIKQLMEITGVGKLAIQAMNQMITVFKQSDMRIPDKFWDDFISEADPNELVEMCIPIYEKHFTHDEIKQLLKFYKTPIGKKVIETQPVIMQECMIAGQEWGKKISEKIVKKLQEEGYK